MGYGFRRLAAFGMVLGLVLAPALRAAEEAGTTAAEAPADTVPSAATNSTSSSTDGALVGGESEEEEAGSSVSFSAGFDLASAYFFRGIPQETKGYLFQPYAGLDLTLLEQSDKSPIGFALNFSTWNSVHSNAVSNPWYESDLSIGGTFSLPAGLEFGAAWVYLYAPSAGDFFTQEVDLSLSFDDSAVLGDMPLGLSFGPSALVAFETEAGSDGLGQSGKEGTYLQLGLEPSVTLNASDDYPVTLSVPLTLGLGLKDYYETSTGRNDTFGFFDVAVATSVPLAFIPKRLGSWSLTGSVHFLFLGEGAKTIGVTDFGVGGDDFNVYGTVGLAIE